VWLYGLVCGSVLFAAASLQQVGIVYTTAGKAGFITGLYVVLVPLSGLLWRQKAGWSRWVGAGLALAGLYLLSVTRGLTIARGDFLVLLSALFWTAHVQLIGWFSPKTDSLVLASIQFAVCALFSLVVALATETVVLEGILRAAVPILYGGLCSVGIAYTLQVVIQKTAHPAHAAIILSLEGAFAVLGGWLILGEVLSLRGLIGCALMLSGMIVSQTSLLRNPAAVGSGVPQP
jgi:drug/metabolite transporter (DMT)-like permease